MKQLLLLTAFIFLTQNLSSQNFYSKWLNQVGAENFDYIGAVKVAESGNIYVTGSFNGVVDFDAGGNTSQYGAVGSNDIFVYKLDESGHLIWVRVFGGSDYDSGADIALDQSENVYVTGLFEGTVDFDPGPGNHHLTSNGDVDAFIFKLNSSGDFQWANTYGDIDDDKGRAVEIGPDGHVNLLGTFQNEVDFDNGPAVFNLTSHNYNGPGATRDDIFLLKINESDGSLLLGKSFGDTLHRDYPQDLEIDKYGNLYITSTLDSGIDFIEASGNTTTLIAQSGNNDTYILKLNGNLDFVWVKQFESTSQNYLRSIKIDQSQNIIVCGQFSETIDLDPNSTVFNLTSSGGYNVNGFVLKLDSNANFVWAHSIGAETTDVCHNVAVDTLNNIYLTGQYSGIVDFDFGPNEELGSATTVSYDDIFVLSVDSNANYNWHETYGGVGTDFGKLIVIDNQQNVIIGGQFSDTAFFDKCQDLTYTSNGFYDMFLQKINIEIGCFLEFAETRKSELKIYPNPSNGQFSVDFDGVGIYQIQIATLDGKAVYSDNISSQFPQINLQNTVTAGIYILTVGNSGYLTTQKLIIK